MKKLMGGLLTGILITLMFAAVGCADAETDSGDETADETTTAESTESETDEIASETDSTDSTGPIGWVISDGATYYYDEAGEKYSNGWYTIEGNTYYFLVSGKMNYGWVRDGENLFYCNPYTGVQCSGWVTTESGKYYFSLDTGAMATGAQTVYGKNYYFNSDGSIYTGWRDADGERSYYDLTTGVAATGWNEIDGYYYYFDESGILQTNTIVGSEEEGYYYVADDGIRVTSEEIAYAVEFVLAYSTEGESNATRLKECYEYLWNNYPYNRTYESPDASTMSEEAIAIFSNGYGNCFKYASAFACIAKVLGYNSKVCVGEIVARGGGMTPHGWSEVESDGTWYMCDPDMQMNYPTRNVYMVLEANYPYGHNVTVKYTLTITNGEVSWE